MLPFGCSKRRKHIPITESCAAKPGGQASNADLAVAHNAEVPGPGDTRLQRGNGDGAGLRRRERTDAEEDDSTRSRQTLTESKVTKVLVKSQQRSALGRGDAENFGVGNSGLSLRYRDNIESTFPQYAQRVPRKVLIRDEPHAGWRGTMRSVCKSSAAYAKQA